MGTLIYTVLVRYSNINFEHFGDILARKILIKGRDDNFIPSGSLG
jgi:hypothetical protein